jgi:hypothetical protein
MPHNALVRLIYEAANDPLLWDPFLTKFAEAVHAETTGFLIQDKTGQSARILATVGMEPAFRNSYEEYFVSCNPWLRRRTVSPGTVETSEQVLSNRELVRTEFYHDFLRPNIWLHACSAVTNVEDSTFSSVYALRTPHKKAFTPDEIQLCSYLAPHLQTAARIRQRIVDLEATLDRVLVGEMDTNTLAKLGLTRSPACRRFVQGPERGSVCEGSRDQHQHSPLAYKPDLRQDRREATERANPNALEVSPPALGQHFQGSWPGTKSTICLNLSPARDIWPFIPAVL